MTTERSATAPTKFIDAGGITFAYRRLGQAAGVPLVFLQHFTVSRFGARWAVSVWRGVRGGSAAPPGLTAVSAGDRRASAS
jgi:hypothetical protein